MGCETVHNRVLHNYIKHISLQDSMVPITELDLGHACIQLLNDITMFRKIRDSCYIHSCTPIPKNGCIHLAWEYAKDPAQHYLFVQMLRVSPMVFEVIHQLIKDHPVFHNNSNNPQSPVDYQLAVTLFCMGCYGNGASIIDIAHDAGCSSGAVEDFTRHCFTAIESLHDTFARPLSAEEKESYWISRIVARGLGDV